MRTIVCFYHYKDHRFIGTCPEMGLTTKPHLGRADAEADLEKQIKGEIRVDDSVGFSHKMSTEETP